MSIASELTNLRVNISNAYDAIDNKGGTLPADKNTANLATAISSISGGGGSAEVVNGIIANFKATSSTIDANTFVEFVNNITTGTDTRLSTGSNSYYYASAVLVDNDKVFIAHRNGNYLYGVVCTISGTTITTGTDTQLSTASNSYEFTSVAKLDTGKVFVAHRSSGYLYGVVCTINGTAITAGTNTQLAEMGTGTYNSTSAVTLSTGKVLVLHGNFNLDSALYGVVCTINGTAITAGTDTQITDGANSYQYVSAVLVDTDKVFVAHRNSGTLYGVVCTISDTTITSGTPARLFQGSYTYYGISVTLAAPGKVFIAHARSDAITLYGVVCTITGTTITVGVDTVIVSAANAISNNYFSAVTLDTDKVFIAHRNGSYLYGVVCIISGTTITAGTDTQLSTASNSYEFTSVAKLDTDKVFVAHRNGSYLYGVVCNTSDFTVETSMSKVHGLTKTECTTSTAGEVWVLDA